MLRHESELGSWELVRRAPDPRLRGFVDEYEGYVERDSPAPVLRQEVPTTRVPVIITFEGAWLASSSPAGVPEAYRSFTAGLFERSTFVAATGPARCIQANFTPLGASRLLGIGMNELANRIVALEDALPPSLRALPDLLEDRPTWERRFALLDELLLARLRRAQESPPDIAWAWAALERTHGRAPIGWICERLGRSRRHVVARFRAHVGLPPKTVARIMRFERAVRLLERETYGLADLAFACGYYDQAHMNRDFREFADASPLTVRRRIVPDGGVLA